MNRIAVIGAGFAGRSVIRQLLSSREEIDLTLVEKKLTSDFLPLLPDVIGGRVQPDYLAVSLDGLSERMGFSFVQDEVIALDLEKRVLNCRTRRIPYDYLVIASGTETNFYNQEDVKLSLIHI